MRVAGTGVGEAPGVGSAPSVLATTVLTAAVIATGVDAAEPLSGMTGAQAASRIKSITVRIVNFRISASSSSDFHPDQNVPRDADIDSIAPVD